MAWLENAAAALVQFGANWLVQSSLLIAAGLLAAAVARRAALQSAVCRATLFAVAAAPAASFVVSALGYTTWNWPLPAVLSTSESNSPAFAAVSGEEAPAISPWNDNTNASSAADDGVIAPAAVDRPAETPSITEPSRASREIAPASSALPTTMIVLALGWLAGSSLLLVRLTVACLRARRLQASSSPVGDHIDALCRELASRLGVTPPAVRQSPFVASPCLLGCLRPTILLPAEQPPETLRNVLIHELSHLRRRDGHWLLFERLLASVLCFQPLLRLLAWRLEAAAEAVCDDQVLALGAERAGYARGLAELAQRTATPIATVGVGLFARRSMLHHRVVRIMNAKRSLSTHVGWRPLVLVVVAAAGLTLAAGAIGAAPRPLGDQPMPANAAASADRHVIVGQITGPNGQLLAGALVAAMATPTAPQRGGELAPNGEVLAEVVSDAEGRYRLEHSGSSQTHREATLVARGPETALAWKPLDLDADQAEIPFSLEPGTTLAARLVDAKGNAAVGVTARVASIVPRVEGQRFPDQKVSAWGMKSLPQAWPQPTVSDNEGRIVFSGLPAGHGAYVSVEGTEQFAPQHLAINTGIPTERGERDGTYRPQSVNPAAAEEPVARLEPAQVITGRITYADTGLPAPHARLTISASQEKYGSMISVPGQADAEGRYRISVMPGVQFGVTAYPPDGVPYLGREEERFDWRAGDTTREVDLTLPRGVVVQGRVLDGETPVAGATVLYLPESDNNRRGAPDVLTGWQAIELTDAEGRYRIAVLPGVGRLLVTAASDEFVPREVTSRELWRGERGGERIHAHAIERIDPAEGSPPVDLDLQLERGGHAAGQLVDQQGARIEQALLFSTLLFDRYGGNWRGFPQELVGGHFRIGGLPVDGQGTAYFFEPRRKLGATVALAAGKDQQVVLEPCGQAALRFVDGQGQPIPKHDALVELVATPGVSRFDRQAMEAGQLAADTVMISNMDRSTYGAVATGEDGRLTLPALIPEATYRVSTFRDGGYRIAKEFAARSGESLELGDVVVVRNEKE